MQSLSLAIVAGLALGAQSGSGSASSPPTPAVAPAATPLERALAAARVSGKPVLVIVVSEDPAVRACRSRWLSDWLAVAEPWFRSELAFVEIAFATREQIGARLAEHRRGDVERGELGWLDPLDAELEWRPIESASGTWCVPREGPLKALEQGAAMSTLADQILMRTHGDEESTKRRALAARRSLNKAEFAKFEESLARPSEARSALVDRCAWLYRRSLRQKTFWGLGKFEDALAAAATARLIDSPPHGARWASFESERTNLQMLECDDADERELLMARAWALRAPALDAPGDRKRREECALGPCGTSANLDSGYVFLNEYTRVLVDATDLD